LQGGIGTVAGLKVALGLAEFVGDTVVVRGRGPENKLKVLMVIFEITELLGRRVTGLELALRV
jgi:hypothetical protein